MNKNSLFHLKEEVGVELIPLMVLLKIAIKDQKHRLVHQNLIIKQ